MLKTDFEPLDDIEMIVSLSNLCVVRTYKLLPTLQFMQRLGWRLYEIQADDEWDIECNLLTYYKPKWQKQN